MNCIKYINYLNLSKNNDNINKSKEIMDDVSYWKS